MKCHTIRITLETMVVGENIKSKNFVNLALEGFKDELSHAQELDTDGI